MSSSHHLLLSYTKLLAAHVNHGRHRQALALFSKLYRDTDLAIDAFVFPLALKSCAALSLLHEVASVHAHAVRTNLLLNPFVASALVDAYGKSDASPSSLSPARRLFDEVPERNVVVWNAMISLCARSGDVSGAMRLFESMDVAPNASTFNSVIAGLAEEAEDGRARALEFYHRMRALGIRANLITLLALLPTCVSIASLIKVKEIHGFAARSSADGHPQMSSGLVEAYGRCGSSLHARKLFDGMPVRDVVAWSAMVSVHAFHGEADAALATFREMLAAGVRPDGVAFLAVLKACSHAGMADEALGYFRVMRREYGAEVSRDHYACLVDALSRAGRLREAYDVIRGTPGKATAKAWGALLGACRSHGEVRLAGVVARALFEMEPENVGNFVILASVYAGAGMFEEAEQVREEMRERFVKKSPGSSWVT